MQLLRDVLGGGHGTLEPTTVRVGRLAAVLLAQRPVPDQHTGRRGVHVVMRIAVRIDRDDKTRTMDHDL